MRCARTACGRAIDGKHVAVWNDPSTEEPRLYCVRCGTAIVRYNRDNDREALKLRYEVREATASGVDTEWIPCGGFGVPVCESCGSDTDLDGVCRAMRKK